MSEPKNPTRKKKHSEAIIYKYKNEWENKEWAKGWLEKSSDVDKQAYCRACRKIYRAHATDLEKHSKNPTHMSNMNSVHDSKQPKIKATLTKDISIDRKKEELRLTVYNACHTSVRSIDHLTSILNMKGLKRTKTAALIKYVIAPNILKDLLTELGDEKFSIIADESTDVSKKKFLCLCIRYFNKVHNCILTDYLGLIEIDKADANTLFDKFVKFFKENQINVKNMIGLGTDGGSNLCGCNHSLYTLLKEIVPHLQLVKCICHTLSLAASDAAEEFPSALEALMKWIYNYFSNSTLRRANYREFWDLLNSMDEAVGDTQKNFYQFVQLSQTRWLARYHAVKVIAHNYFELHKFFQDVTKNDRKDYAARQLFPILDDFSNYIFIKIVEPILLEVNSVNLLFQRESVDVNSAYDELKNLIMFLAQKILKPTYFCSSFETVVKNMDLKYDAHVFLPLDKVNYGIEYRTACLDIKLDSNQTISVHDRAFRYMKRLCRELISRLPSNLDHFEKLKSVSVNVCLSQLIRSNFEDLPFLSLYVDKNLYSKLDAQYTKLMSVEWHKILDEKKLCDSQMFWAAVYVYKNSVGTHVFRELATYALSVLSLPTSNAVVERVFSVMNFVKPKCKNQMQVLLLDSILRIKMNFCARKICCHLFQPSQGMLNDFNASVMYPEKYESDAANDLSKDDNNEDVLLEEMTIELAKFNWPNIVH